MTIHSLATACLSNHICHHFPVQILFTQTNFLIPTPSCTPQALSFTFNSNLLLLLECCFFSSPDNLNVLVSKVQPRPLPWTFHDQSRHMPLSLFFPAIDFALTSWHSLTLLFHYCTCSCVISPVSHWFWRAGASSSIAPAPPAPLKDQAQC